MIFADNILRQYLKNVFFITGTAYAGKSTMCARLAREHGLYHYAENARAAEHRAMCDPQIQRQFCYQRRDWDAFFNRTPEEYERWIYEGSAEEAELEVLDLVRLSEHQRVITDTIIPIRILREIAAYGQVAVMLSPQSMSVERFFDREDKDDILACIQSTRNPEATMENFKRCLARINSPEHYREYEQSGFYCLYRGEGDTREENYRALERHFGLA